jgi:DNA-binding winged helix-turn-helix (wHTH) protein
MGGVISFGPFRLFATERQLKKGDEALQLGGRALDTLIALIERAGEVVTQGELISRVWPDVTVEEANLRVNIASLRKALGDGREGARYIVTLSGRGYCFVAPVTRSAPQHSPSKEAAAFDRLQDLPPKLTRMIGRDDTIRGLSAQLMMCRFVSIVGPAGIGKTTVAISVAHTLLDGFNGAVFFVDLAALTDAKLVAMTVAQALGLMVSTQDALRSLPAFIGDRKFLLVLDNCEHVIDAAATLAKRVVGETPQAHVLTTSRDLRAAARDDLVGDLRQRQIRRFVDDGANHVVTLGEDRLPRSADLLRVEEACLDELSDDLDHRRMGDRETLPGRTARHAFNQDGIDESFAKIVRQRLHFRLSRGGESCIRIKTLCKRELL